MLLSELLGMRVRSRDGEDLGRIVDVRFRRGPRKGEREGTLELVGLIVSPHSRSSFYGYERGRVSRPIVIAKAIAWLHRRSRIVPWECVQRVDDDVVLGVAAPLIPLDVRRAPAGTPDR